MPPTSISEDDCLDVLRRVFKHANYKGKQKEIIKGACEGRDVFVLAPTGMGKVLPRGLFMSDSMAH
jgi:bloom syndrome protein